MLKNNLLCYTLAVNTSILPVKIQATEASVKCETAIQLRKRMMGFVYILKKTDMFQ